MAYCKHLLFVGIEIKGKETYPSKSALIHTYVF